MHEGNTPKLVVGVIGLVVAKIGSDGDEYPYIKILVGDQIYGLFGKYLDLAKQNPDGTHPAIGFTPKPE